MSKVIQPANGRYTTNQDLPAFHILFSTSGYVSTRQRVFQGPLTRARLGCLLLSSPHLPRRALPAPVPPRGWELAGWPAFRLGAFQAARLILLSVHTIGKCDKLQRRHHWRGWGWGVGCINSFLLLPGCASASSPACDLTSPSP